MSSSPHEKEPGGALAWMARNPVAANLLMVVILAGGVLGLTRVKQEVFPEFELDTIIVTVAYPGASPTEVEQGIVLAVEEAVRGIDGVKRVTSTSSEGLATVSLELLLGEEPDRALTDVKGAVDRITSLPIDAERPEVSVATMRSEVISLIVSGDMDLKALHEIGERIRMELLADPEITQVELYGVPPLEIGIEIPRETLEAYDLSLDDVSRQVTMASVELPGGGVKTPGGEILVRLDDRRRSGTELSDVILRSTSGGAEVRLDDLATIRDGYADTDQASYYRGLPAVRITAYRVGDETPMSVAGAVKDHAERLRVELPSTVGLDIWEDDSELLRGRINLLLSNARYGLFLVVLILALLLNLRLAFWVSLGIPISFLGGLFLLPVADLSINMVTLFGFIVTLGLVVDDAIIVGENIFEKRKQGLAPMQAAIEGAREMAVPVTFAILTSVAAFSPLFFVPGTMGKVFIMMPVVVVLVLLFSWVESFFILPAHLAHSREPTGPPGRFDRIQQRVANAMAWHNERVFEPSLRAVLQYRYIAISGAVALFFVALGLVISGVVPFNFMPRLEGDLVTVTARQPYGTPVARTEAVRAVLERAAHQAIEESGGDAIVDGMFTRLGEGAQSRRGARETGSHLVTVELALVPSDERDVSAEQFARRWESHVPTLAGVESLLFNSSTGPGAGAAVDVRMSHTDDGALGLAAADLAETLHSFPALTNVDNSYASGKVQLDFSLLPHAQTLGLTGEHVARQLRAGFYGAEALREQRGRNEIKVMVRLPRDQRRSEFDLEELRIRTPGGGHVPFGYVAEFDRGRAPTSIYREDGIRAINVSASLAPGVRSGREVLDDLTEDEFPALKKRYPGLTMELVGGQREQQEAFAALGRGYLLALLAIFGLLAIPFRSYTQPLIIMSAIPFGFIGAVAGHIIMGYEVTVISMFGVIALSGVVVNDSLVLIDAVNRARKKGASATEAVVAGALRRFRPILLTSLTTFFGLAPMIFESSVQARFLVPMAVSLGYGILFSTFVVLLIVPSLYMVLDDAKRVWAWLRSDEPEAVEVEA
jgi:multidrug efflux pump subunit AcrB